MDELIKQAEALGIKVDKRWKEERLREEIARVQPAEPVVEETEAEQEEAVEEADTQAGADESVQEEGAAPDAEAKPIDDGGASEPEVAGITIKNLTENPNKRLGIGAGDTLTLTSEQLADRQFMARIDHGVATGVLGIV